VAVAALVRESAADLILATPMAENVERGRLEAVADLATGSSWVAASGAGRVFEAAGALLGVAPVNRWEGEAAARLEALAARAEGSVEPWRLDLVEVGSVPVLRTAGLLAEVARRAAAGEPPEMVAAGFHATLCAGVAEITALVAREEDPVALGGGCVINRLLVSGLRSELGQRGIELLLPHHLPPGDGGLSYGQAVIAAVGAARGVTPRQTDVAAE
jgi:hydrogenase maturation protein HypF